MRVGGHVELHVGRLALFLALHFADGLGDHLAIQVVANRSDVTTLRLAEQVACAANFEVAHRDLESATKVGGLADGLESFVGLFGEGLVAGVEQIGVGTRPAATNAAAQLVHLAEAE